MNLETVLKIELMRQSQCSITKYKNFCYKLINFDHTKIKEHSKFFDGTIEFFGFKK